MSERIDLSDDQLEVILHDLLDLYGYDFKGYSKTSLKRRVHWIFAYHKFQSFADFRLKLKGNKGFLDRFVEQITVSVTEMFRDPGFYRVLRESVLPRLNHSPMIRIWHAGCSTGEEVYSMAIMLHEAGLLERSQIFATDISPAVLEKFKFGTYPLSRMKLYHENYLHSGGKKDFESYYTTRENAVRFDDSFGRKIVLATHNLVSDKSFSTFQLILCRNVMIYFDKRMHDKVLRMFYESLEPNGFFGLGAKETLKFTAVDSKFKQLEGNEKIWIKIPELN
jgi:chemotaxis protein methyltransferase CheR